MELSDYLQVYPVNPEPNSWPRAIRNTQGNTHRRDNPPQNALKSIEDILTTEIWTFILDMVVKEYAGCFENCSSEYFPRFLREWNYERLPCSTYLNEWRQLRLVCRLWAEVIDPNWTLYWHSWNERSIARGRNIRTIYVFDNGCWDEMGNIERQYDFVRATRQVSTVIIDEQAKYGRKYFIESLLEQTQMFSSLRSLRLSTLREESLDTKFWSDLENGFPHLIALRISNRDHRYESSPLQQFNPGTNTLNYTGSINLPKLEVLHLALDRIPHCRFRSLKHCAIYPPRRWKKRGKTIPATDPEYNLYLGPWYDLLRSHGRGLESLVLFDFPDSFILNREEDLWSSFPNLRLLGTSSFVASELNPPSPNINHPFNHIFINAADEPPFNPNADIDSPPIASGHGSSGYFQRPSPTSLDVLMQISTTIRNIPHVEYLTLDTQIKMAASHKCDFPLDVEKLCKRKKIIYFTLSSRQQEREGPDSRVILFVISFSIAFYTLIGALLYYGIKLIFRRITMHTNFFDTIV